MLANICHILNQIIVIQMRFVACRIVTLLKVIFVNQRYYFLLNCIIVIEIVKSDFVTAFMQAL